MMFSYDLDSDSLYIHLNQKPPVLQQEMGREDGGAVIDIDEDGGVCGIEVLSATRQAWQMHKVIDRYPISVADADLLLRLEDRRWAFKL